MKEARKGGGGGGFGFGRRGAVLEFTRAVASLLPAGMPLARALGAGTTAAPESVRPALESVRSKVERGDGLASSLAEHPRLFSSLYVGMVRAGERVGPWTIPLHGSPNTWRRESELRSKLVSMSIYPLLWAWWGSPRSWFWSSLFYPVSPIFSSPPGRPFPLLRRRWWVSPRWFGPSGGFWPFNRHLLPLLTWLRTTEQGRKDGGPGSDPSPAYRGWRRQHLAATFARMVGELVSGGAPLLLALDDARDCMTDSVAQEETDRIRTLVREGSSLNGAIAQGGLFPPVLTQLVALGEDAGRLADFLLKAAELLEKKTERALERLVALVEPAMIVGFGGIVAVVALALLQAIYGVNAGSF